MEIYNLYHLPDDVLFLSNDNFYNFVIQVCGKIEAELLQIQGIRNVRSLIRSTNLFSILEIDCDEIDKLKENICFISKDGTHIIRQGVKLNLDNLYDALKEKQEKYKKKHRQQELFCSVPTSQGTNTNINNNDNLTTQNLTVNVTTGITNSNPSSSKYISINDHTIFIKDLIEKFSFKTFTSTILKNDEHYQLIITQDEQQFKAVIKCQCGAKLTLPSRSESSTFILSNFYAHLTVSNCSMVERIRKQEKNTGNKEVNGQPLSTSDAQLPASSSSNNSSVVTNSLKRTRNGPSSEINKSSRKKKR